MNDLMYKSVTANPKRNAIRAFRTQTQMVAKNDCNNENEFIIQSCFFAPVEMDYSHNVVEQYRLVTQLYQSQDSWVAKENKSKTADYVDFLYSQSPKLDEEILALKREFEREKSVVLDFLNSESGNSKMEKAISKIVTIKADKFSLEIRDEETVIFILSFRDNKRMNIRYHLADESPEHESSLSFFVGKSFIDNCVGTFDSIIEEANAIIDDTQYSVAGKIWAIHGISK